MKLIEKWTFKYDEPILSAKLSAPTNTNTKTLFVSTKSGKILILDLNGNLLIEEEIIENSPIWKLDICDLNNDGNEELILGGMDGLLRVFKISSQTSLEPIWAHQFGSSISGFKIGQIKNNSNFEIIAYSLDKSLRVLNSNDGALVWGQVFEDGIEDARIWTELKNSNKKEVLACGNDGTIRVFEAKNGNLLWFKRFSDKVRFIDYINSDERTLIICGGDDKKLHFINKESQKEIKTIDFDDYVWKCHVFPNSIQHSFLISSYSFEYLETTKLLQEINFSSRLICYDHNLEPVWELLNKNVEVIFQFQIVNQIFIAIGTTQGELLILNGRNGIITSTIDYNSPVNAIDYENLTKLLIICYEDGLITALNLVDN